MNSFFDRLVARTGTLCFALALGSGALACDDGTDDDMGDGDTTGDGDGDTTGGEFSHAADIQPIWDDNCTSASCHAPGGTAQFLDLSGDAFGNLVGTPSTQAMGDSVVEAGSSQNSYLIAKLRGTQMEFGGSGNSMPAGVGASPLPEETIMLIEAWIDEGALP